MTVFLTLLESDYIVGKKNTDFPGGRFKATSAADWTTP